MTKQTYDIRVTDRRPKAIIREMLRRNLGPRDYEGRNAMWERWWAILDREGYVHTRFVKWIRSQDWTLGELLSYLEYNVCYIFGGIDEKVFQDEWEIIRPIIKGKKLLAPSWIAEVTGENAASTKEKHKNDMAAIEL